MKNSTVQKWVDSTQFYIFILYKMELKIKNFLEVENLVNDFDFMDDMDENDIVTASELMEYEIWDGDLVDYYFIG